MKQAYHGGAFFEAIGPDFSSLERADHVVSADVLDAWFPPSPRVIQKIQEHLPFLLSTSPPTHADGLVQTIAEYRCVTPQQVLAGGGSSDLIFLLLQHLVEKGDRVMILDPMYGEYAHVLAHVVEAQVHRFLLDSQNEFRVDIDQLTTEITTVQPQVMIIVNPNSPTGQYSPREEIIRLLGGIPKSTIVVVDETYIEYVGAEHSLEAEVQRFPNLVVIKSMSKAYGLSGARVGYMIAQPDFIQRLAPYSPPWSVGLIAQVAAVEALKDSRYYAERYAETHRLREDYEHMLSKVLGLKVYPSVANFLLVEITAPDCAASTIVADLKAQDIFVRQADSMSTQFKNRFFRVAVKEEPANRRVASAIATVMARYATPATV